MDTSGLHCMSCSQNHYIKLPENELSTVEIYIQELYDSLKKNENY
jgi:hypothetical protein